MRKATTTNEDRHLERIRDQHFPKSRSRRWPPAGGAGWFKAPRALSVLLQILTEKDVVERGNPGPAYVELLARVREPGFIILEHPAEHARIVGYSRQRTWTDAMRQLSEIGFIEVKEGHDREFAYALIVNPLIAVRRLHNEERISDTLWDLFYEKWTKAGADVPEEEEEPVRPKKAPAHTPLPPRGKRGAPVRSRTSKKP